ncbi:MAG: RluA family pseudouridine synthase [Kiritimatiellae bacterium]|nr:RluA family pseudouridine synthase [Kiritimatiellia bacterium]
MSEKAHNTVLTVTKAETGVTLQNFLAERLKLSKRGAKDLIDQRQVWVNRQCIWMARHLLRGGDTVEAQAGTAAQAVQSVKRIRILSETDRYLFADKPYGMLTIGPGGLEEALREQTGNSALRCVHRLDKDTSGCLLVAKDDEAFDAAVSVFKTRRVKKLYEFLAVGRIETAASTIATPIDDEPAKTTIRRIAFNNDATFGSARIETGRTHQIRIHLASIRHPVVGDRLHGLKTSRDPRFMRVPRQMLHATELELDDPLGRGHLRAHSPLPADFRRCLQMFGLGK